VEINMCACSWEDIQNIISDTEELKIGAGGEMELSTPSIYFVASASWLDFLNADPANSRSMWFIYRDCARCIQESQAWLTEKGYRYNAQMRLLSREEFLERYSAEWQADAEKLHRAMKRAIDEGKVDLIKDVSQYADQEKYSRAKEILTGGAGIPILSFGIRVTNPCDQAMSVRMLDPRQMQIDIPEVNHPALWLHAILGGMVSSYRDGKILRRCLACPKYFYPRGRAQKFHNPTCRSRYNVKKWRQSQL